VFPRVRDHIADAARNAVASKWFERFARAGFAAKGVVFGVIGILIGRVAFGERQEDADAPGALEALGDEPVTAVLLGILAIGLIGYALWRFTQAFADVEGEGSDASGLARRAAYFWIGGTYTFFAVISVMVLTGWRRAADDDGVTQITAFALELPLGAWLVGIAGAVVILAGLREVLVAITGQFKEEFARERMSDWERRAARYIGWYGHAARGAAFVMAGIFAIRAAATVDPEEARGMADTFTAVADERFGTLILLVVAAGFVSFGLYCILLALHRHMPNEAVQED
jgi:hypothetical protein